MSELPEFKPPRRRPVEVSWLAGGLGLLLMNVAADSFAAKAGSRGWLELAAGLALLVFALWWAGKRRR